MEFKFSESKGMTLFLFAIEINFITPLWLYSQMLFIPISYNLKKTE